MNKNIVRISLFAVLVIVTSQLTCPKGCLQCSTKRFDLHGWGTYNDFYTCTSCSEGYEIVYQDPGNTINLCAPVGCHGSFLNQDQYRVSESQSYYTCYDCIDGYRKIKSQQKYPGCELCDAGCKKCDQWGCKECQDGYGLVNADKSCQRVSQCDSCSTLTAIYKGTTLDCVCQEKSMEQIQVNLMENPNSLSELNITLSILCIILAASTIIFAILYFKNKNTKEEPRLLSSEIEISRVSQ